MDDCEDLNDKYDKFSRTSLQTCILLAQLIVVLAALLCSQWWHYALLALFCIAMLPFWGNMYADAQDRWWKQNEGEGGLHVVSRILVSQGASPEEASDVIEEGLDEVEQMSPPQLPKDKNWPFNMGAGKDKPKSK